MDIKEDEVLNSTPNSFLAKIWRSILIRDGYLQNITRYRNAYIESLVIASELSNTTIVINKTNINDKIVSKNMTWRNLVFLLRKILKIKDINVKMCIKRDGVSTTYDTNGLSDDLLSIIWSGLLTELKYDSEKVEELMLDYIASITTEKNKNQINKTNIKNKIFNDSMTWKNLCFLLEKILRVTDVVFTMKLKHSNNTFTTHSDTFILGK